MSGHLSQMTADADEARSLVCQGLKSIRSRCTCTQRVDELLFICKTLRRVDT